MHPFRQAVQARDHTAIEALLADDVVFTSPVAFQPYPGKPITAAILRGVMRVFDDFMVMVRPLSGASALADAMGAQFDRIQNEALQS